MTNILLTIFHWQLESDGNKVFVNSFVIQPLHTTAQLSIAHLFKYAQGILYEILENKLCEFNCKKKLWCTNIVFLDNLSPGISWTKQQVLYFLRWLRFNVTTTPFSTMGLLKLELELELEKCLLDKIAHNMYKKNSQYECQIHCTNCQEILILVTKETAVIRTTHEKTGQYIMPCYQLSIPWKYHQIVISRHSYSV